MLKRFFHITWLLAVTLLCLAAIVLTVVRLWIPVLGDYHRDIQTAAADALQKQVSIGRLEATWRGLSPVLKLKDVAIGGEAGMPQRPDIREIWISIDVVHFLKERELRFSGIDIIGADLGLVRNMDGSLYLDKFSGGDGEGGDALAKLLQLSRLSIHDSVISLHDLPSGKPPYRLSDVTMSLSNAGYTHTLAGYVMLPGELGYRIDLEAELYGRDTRFRDWQGRLYAKGQSVALPAGLARSLPETVVLQGVADVRLWADIAGARLETVSAEFDVHDFMLEHVDATRSYRFAVDNVSGQLGWESSDQGWQFALQNFTMQHGDRLWHTDNLSIAGGGVEGVAYLNGRSAEIDVGGLSGLLPVVPGLTVEQRRRLAELQPRGLIKDLHFAIERSHTATTLTGFSARFAGLSIEQSGGIPLLSGLNGEISGSLAAGTMSIDSHYAGIHDERLFREVLQVEHAQGDVHWQMTDERLERGADDFIVKDSDLALRADFAAAVPITERGTSINLQLAVEHADVGQISRYLPAGVMPPRSVAWLDKSLKSGVVTNGSVVINGRLDQIPFDRGEGLLEVQLPVTGAVLDYNPDWSPVTGLDAQVNFSGRSMDIRSRRGAIRNTSLDGVRAQISNLARPELTITGNVHGDVPVMLAELGSSPLGNTYGGFVDRVSTRGPGSLWLDIKVPLSKAGTPVEVAGRISLKGNTLKVDEADITLEGIRGELAFDGNGIDAKDLKVKLFGRPARARVWTEKGRGITNIQLDGRLGLIDRVLDKDSKLRSLVSGNPYWRTVLSIRGMPARGEKANVGLVVTTSLAGTAIDLPPPFGKEKDGKRALSISIDRIDRPQKIVRVGYGKVLQAVLKLGEDAQGAVLRRGVIALGDKKPVLPDSRELLVSGRLEHFNADDWKPLLGEGGDVPALPFRIALDISKLEVFGHYLHDVNLYMKPAGRVWDIRLEGPSVTGDVALTKTPSGVEKAVMTLDRLKLESAEGALATTKAEFTPADFPELQVTAQQFVYDRVNYGVLELSAQKRSGNTLEISRLAVSSDMLAVRMQGQWKLQNGEQISSLNLTVSGGELEKLLDAFGYQESMKDGALSGSVRMTWPGAPWAYSPERMEGRIRLKITDGQLLNVEPGAAGRVLGLLSLNSLPRRLLLDFSDLFADGFSFDTIAGGFLVDGGNAYTNDLVVNGPAAKIEITGRVGLIDQDYDELVTVTPYVKTGVSLVGALAGGPAVGAVLMVAETLLEGKGGTLGKMAQKQYSVTGPWSDPVITRLKPGAAKTEETDEDDYMLDFD
jgi:uncharacterized protein (TIGR02099 family)